MTDDLSSEARITELLRAAEGGERDVLDELMPLVYDDLRGVARGLFRGPRVGQTLQPTVVVHEAYAKLANAGVAWESRKHFFAVAARAMRQVLADHAKGRLREKRGGGAERVTLSGQQGEADALDLEVVSLHEALERLERAEPNYARVVELRYLVGLSVEEAAEVLGVSDRTVKARWRAARAWLVQVLADADADADERADSGERGAAGE